MSKQTGRKLPVSRFRGMVVDLTSFCQKVPGATVERPMKLGALVAARQACVPRPSWTAIFLKAMSIVAARRPELRRSYMPFPRAYLYEHPINIANFTIERDYAGEELVFFVQIRSPERRLLTELDGIIRTCKDEPVESVKFFQRAIRMSKVPWPFRWFSMWFTLNIFGKLRCHNFGTFSLTSIGSAGAGVLTMPPLLTTTLHYGLFDEHGNLPMRITFDHCALDGCAIARALVQLEDVLMTEILAELHASHALKAA